SNRALAILKAMPRCGDYIFPGAKEGRPLSDMALTQLLRGLDGNGFTVHGYRSTFRDWAGERTNYGDETIEFALAHSIPDKAKAAYRRYRALDKRARLMQSWSDYCEGKAVAESGAVVSIGARAS